MNKIQKIILLSVMLVSIAFAETKHDFRNTTWKMSIDEVKKLETSKFEQEEVIPVLSMIKLIYKGSIEGFECKIGYEFLKGKLLWGGYKIIKNYENPEDYIIDFNKLKQFLINEYGEPIKDKQIWRNENYKDRLELWGLAVLNDQLDLISIWKTDTTVIELHLKGGEEISPVILYSEAGKVKL